MNVSITRARSSRTRRRLVASVYQMLLMGATRSTEDYFPKYFDYNLPDGTTRRKPLFGDLPRAIMDRGVPRPFLGGRRPPPRRHCAQCKARHPHPRSRDTA